MIEEILPSLFRVEIPLPDSPLKSINSYFFKSKNRNLIVDTGFNRAVCRKAMNSALNKLEIDLNETDFFITHLHADHFGLVGLLKTETSTVYFNRPDSEILDGWQGFDQMFGYAKQNGFPIDELKTAFNAHPGHKSTPHWKPDLKLLKDGDKIQIGNYNLICVETPGHTMGHTCLYESNAKFFLTGDHVLGDITPNIQGWSDDQNMLQYYLDSLSKVYNFDVNLVLPGHRSLFSNYKERIDQLKKHHVDRLDEVLSILAKTSKQAFQVASEMTWDIKCETWTQFPTPQKWFATGEAIAHLRYLEDKNLVYRETTKTKTIYSLKKSV